MRPSIVISCYNGVGTIEKIGHAVRSAPVSDIEIVIVGLLDGWNCRVDAQHANIHC